MPETAPVTFAVGDIFDMFFGEIPTEMIEARLEADAKPKDTSQMLLNLKIEMVPTCSIHIDPDTQRRLDLNWVRSIVRNFNSDLFNPLCLARCVEDGLLYCVDGQHGLEGAKELHISPVPAVILPVPRTKAEIAKLFLDKNRGRKKISLADDFRVALAHGSELETMIVQIANEYGFRVNLEAKKKSSGAINALGALKRIAGKGELHARRVFTVCHLVWGDNQDAVNQDVLFALDPAIYRRLNSQEDSDENNLELASLIRNLQRAGWTWVQTRAAQEQRKSPEKTKNGGMQKINTELLLKLWDTKHCNLPKKS